MVSSSKHFRIAGFTLLEFLVTVAICSILAALLAAGLSKSSSNATSTKCLSNLRQISGALFAYAADNDNKLPPLGKSWPPDSDSDWYYRVWPYAGYDTTNYDPDAGPRAKASIQKGGDNIFRCPVTRRKPVAAPGVAEVNANRTSYGLNSYTTSSGDELRAVALSQVEHPGKKVMISESSYVIGSRWYYLSAFGMTPHNKGSNFAFFDGHVEWREFAKLPTDSNEEFWKLPD